MSTVATVAAQLLFLPKESWEGALKLPVNPEINPEINQAKISLFRRELDI